ncbi:MAG TPA: hypothetical protein VE979_15970 [Streptosporangiaceae bacterium]|jgi:hypothetical protein|nr:hypothetical protein [Streptosporangiaceae bacterium]
MSTPTRTDPPHVPLRHGGWPVQKAPRWLLVAGALVLAGGVLTGLAHHPTRSQRAADVNTFLTEMTTDIQSCAGGVRESLTALHAIESGAEHDVPTATHIATYGASNCSPANNELLDNLTQYQVSESLASFGLPRVVDGLVTWAFPDAQQVQTDVAHVLGASGAARAAANAKLQRDLRTLDAQRAYLNKIMMNAVSATSATGKLPPLPG